MNQKSTKWLMLGLALLAVSFSFKVNAAVIDPNGANVQLVRYPLTSNSSAFSYAAIIDDKCLSYFNSDASGNKNAVNDNYFKALLSSYGLTNDNFRVIGTEEIANLSNCPLITIKPGAKVVLKNFDGAYKVTDADTVEKISNTSDLVGWNVVEAPERFIGSVYRVKSTDPYVITCTDSDGGKNEFVRGRFEIKFSDGNSAGGMDMCTADGKSVNESYCDNNKYYQIIIPCVNGCSEGVCKKDVATNCTDNDGGKNEFVKGTVTFKDANGGVSSGTDLCFGASILGEYFCENNAVSQANITCANGCENGACKRTGDPYVISCTDSDGGKNEFVRGKFETKFSNGTIGGGMDMCTADGKSVNESYCDGNKYYQTAIPCANGCAEGACKKVFGDTKTSDIKTTDTAKINDALISNNSDFTSDINLLLASGKNVASLNKLVASVGATRNVKRQSENIKQVNAWSKSYGPYKTYVKYICNNFITYGTPLTAKMGEDARRSALQEWVEYNEALPIDSDDWNDIFDNIRENQKVLGVKIWLHKIFNK